MAAKPSAAQAKAARQKKIVIVGSILFAVIMVIQVPRMMKQLKGPSATAAPATAVAPLPAPLTPASSGVPTVATAPATDKLVSFERFDSKDPFIQQVSESSAVPAKKETGGSATGASAAKSTATVTPTTQPTAFKTDAGGGAAASTGAQTATIQVNGSEQTVSESKTFPKSDPVFKLVSVAQESAQIAIADGSFKDGDKTIRLTTGKSLTLLNTADGKRYKLLLVSTSS
jgi:hypothetical protein